MRVLILGASGFIGGHVARAFLAAGWEVRAGARDPVDAARRLPGAEWIRAEFGGLGEASAWTPLLAGVDAVVNCVGVLQDGGKDRMAAAHLAGPRALIAACQAAGVRRVVHVSAIGAEAQAGTAYARTKAITEALVRDSGLDWVILRPSIVFSRDFYGGTGLMRGLAALPGFIPVLGGGQIFRPVDADDLAQAAVRLAAGSAPCRETLDIAGPQALSQSDLLAALRAWLGYPPARRVAVPRVLAWPAVWLGDLLGWLGWTSSFRSTSIRQMDYDVAGDPDRWVEVTGLEAKGFEALLAAQPASLADRWHARLYFVRPLSILVLGLFWLVTGLVSNGPGWRKAVDLLDGAGLGAWAEPIVWWGAALDVTLGLALWVRAWTAKVAIIMVLATLGYLAAATLILPEGWSDPLGPWLKVLPMMALCLFVAATDERR